MFWKRQILAQDVPIAPVMKVVVRRRRSIKAGNAFAGLVFCVNKKVKMTGTRERREVGLDGWGEYCLWMDRYVARPNNA